MRLTATITWFFILVSCLRPATSLASEDFPAIALNESHSERPIDDYIRYFDDKYGQFTPNTIRSVEDKFIPLSEKTVSLRTDKHWYWIRIHNPKDLPAQWYITTGISTPPLLRGYWQSLTHSDTPEQQAYDRYIPGQTVYQYPIQAFDLLLKPGETGELIIEYKSLANFPLEIRPYTPQSLLKRSERLLFLNGIYMGAIGVFFIFFITQFFIRPNRIHLYYSLFVLSIILIMMQVSGFRMSPENSLNTQHSSVITALIGGSIYVWYFLFSAEFLELKQISPRLNKVLRGLSLAVLILTSLGLFLPMDYVLSVVVVTGLPWPIIAAIWAVRQRQPSAKFFLLGSTTHCFTTYLLLVACLGVETPGNEYFFGLASIGLIFDVCCFAVGILYQNNQLRIRYNNQLQERINDLNSLAESEQISAKALSMSKQAVLNTAATAHDLQQPLSSMQLMLSLQDQQDPIVKQTSEALDYATALLHSALNSSKENYQVLQENINPRRLLCSAIKRHQKPLEEKFIEVRLFCRDGELLCLPLVINRMLDNLLTNARKYTDSGKVLLSGRERKNGDYLIQVWDTGKGMSATQVKKILTPFEQLNQADSANLGFGLGLYIVKSLCNQAGYRLHVRSQEGRGSCFSILIPKPMDMI